jgi:hypothetical protein
MNAGNHSPAAVPQIQQQISHEPDVTVLYIYGRTEPPDVLCHIVAEDDRSHGRFACARATHQQHFALLLALATLRRTHGDYRRPECLAAQREYMYCMFCLCCFARLSRPPASSTASKHRALPATPTPLCDGGVLALTTLFKASNLASDTTIVFSHRRLWLSVVSNIEFVALYTMARWHPSQLHALSLILTWQIPHSRAFHINNHHLPIRGREQLLHCEFQGAASNMLSSPSKEAFSLLSQLEKAFDNPKLMLYTITLKSAMAPVRV